MRRFDLKIALAAAMGLSLVAPAMASADSTGYGYGRGHRARGHGGYGQGYYAAPATLPGGFWDRRGLTIGFTGGLGAMMSEDTNLTDCLGCDYNPVALSGSFHIGGMINPRLALLFELWVTGQTVSFDGTEFVTQAMGLLAAQYWITPQLWIKGGVGAAHLEYTFDDGLFREDVPVDDGLGILASLGYEILFNPYYALDLQLRIGAGSYEGIRDQVTATTVNLGFSWF